MAKHTSIEYCHECGKNMRIELDLGLNGNHVITCPTCGHEHCRVVRGGKITGVRWAQRNGSWGTGATYTAAAYATSATATGSTAGYFMAASWASSSTGGW